MNRRLLTLLCLTAFVLPVWIMNGSCGQPIPPTGGPRDSLPPVFVKSDPRDSALRVKENRITLEFNEYVQVEKAYENVIVSPVPKQAPQVDAKLKQIIIKLHDTLEPNTTYTIDFGNAIKDISPLAPLTKLWTLSLGKNQVKEIAVLEKVNKLSVLDIHDNLVEDLGPLTKQTELKLLMIERNKVKDLKPLVDAAKKDADGPKRFAPYLRLYLTGNPLAEATKTKQLDALKAAGVRIEG